MSAAEFNLGDKAHPSASSSKLQEMQPLLPLKTVINDENSLAQELDAPQETQCRGQMHYVRAGVIIPPENFAIVEDGLYRSVSLKVWRVS